jgi:hypothetical protein
LVLQIGITNWYYKLVLQIGIKIDITKWYYKFVLQIGITNWYYNPLSKHKLHKKKLQTLGNAKQYIGNLSFEKLQRKGSLSAFSF